MEATDNPGQMHWTCRTVRSGISRITGSYNKILLP